MKWDGTLNPFKYTFIFLRLDHFSLSRPFFPGFWRCTMGAGWCSHMEWPSGLKNTNWLHPWLWNHEHLVKLPSWALASPQIWNVLSEMCVLSLEGYQSKEKEHQKLVLLEVQDPPQQLIKGCPETKLSFNLLSPHRWGITVFTLFSNSTWTYKEHVYVQSLREKSQSEQSALNRRVEQLGTCYHAGTVLPKQKTLWPPGPVLNCLSCCHIKWGEFHSIPLQ